MVWLIFRTCSLTLDLASTIDTLALVAAVDLERVNARDFAGFGALWRRILAAVRDIVRTSFEAATESSEAGGGKDGSPSDSSQTLN